MSVLVLRSDSLETPIGRLIYAYDEAGNLRMLDWSDYEPRAERLLCRHYGVGNYKLVRQPDSFGISERLAAYFAGDLAAIDDIPTATGGTAFQRLVWTALRHIPPGSTLSYSELARRIGRAAAIRAVGLANGANPIGVVVPCHRVIGANGALTGYGGGLHRKEWLLAHERTHCGARH